MHRRGGVRIGFVVAAVGVYFGSLLVLAVAPGLEQAGVLDAAQWVIGAIGAAILGDTVRPSGAAESILGQKQGPRGMDGPMGPPGMAGPPGPAGLR